MKQFFKFLVLILLLRLVVAGGGAYAQLAGQPLIDSLIKELPKAKDDTNKANMLTAISFTYYSVNPDEGIKYGQQALELATKLNWKKGIASANANLGINCEYKSDYQKAVGYFQKALKIDEDIQDKNGLATLTGNIGEVYLYQSDYPKALEYYFKALKMNENIGNKIGIAMITGDIGEVYNFQNDFPKALEYCFKALKTAEGTGNKSEIAIITEGIGDVYNVQRDFSKSFEYYLKALKTYEINGDKQGIARVAGSIGIGEAMQKNYIKAIENYQRSLIISREIGSKYMVAFNLSSIGTSFLSIVEDTSLRQNPGKYSPTGGKKGLLRSAIDYLQQSLVISKEIYSPQVIQVCYKSLAEAYKLTGDYKKSLEAADNYHAVKDSVFSAENNKKIIQQGMKYEYGKREDSIKLENARKEKTAALKLQQQRNYTYMGVAGIIGLVAFSFFIIKERRKSERLLLNILPAEVATELKNKGITTARHYDNVTVLFTDFVNFTTASERMSAQSLIDELHTCFKAFDEITGKYNIEKIKTIGDAYLAVCGLPTADPKHAENTVSAAIEINAFMQDRVAKLSNNTFDIRIGIHSGSVVAGIVGVKKFAYDIWGDTVNTAARMEQNSEAGKINISQATYELVKDKFACEYRGEIEAKGKGVMRMYYVV